MKKRLKKRVYTLRDLVAIAEQLGCRLRFEMIPEELLRAPRDADPPASVSASGAPQP